MCMTPVCAQTVPPGYDFVQGREQPGYDIRQVPKGTWAQLAQACQEVATCVMVNTDGWLKNSKAGQWDPLDVGNPCGGSLVKQGENCLLQSFIWCICVCMAL